MAEREDEKVEELSGGRARGVRFRLVVTRPDGAVRAHDVGSAPIAVGRSEDSDVQLDEARVSRHHCVIFSRAGRLNVQDQGSANGTYVNGEWVTHAPLSHGDEILVGSTKLRVEAVGLAGLYGVALRRATSSMPPPPPSEPEPLQAGRGWPPTDPAVVGRLGALLAAAGNQRAANEAAVLLLLEAVPVDRAFLYLRAEGSADLTVAAAKERYGGTVPRARPSLALVRQVAEAGEPLHCFDVASDPRLSHFKDLAASDMAAIMLAPVKRGGEVLGTIYGDSGVLGAVTRSSIPAFNGVATQAGLALGCTCSDRGLADGQARLARERDELDRLVRTLEREVQRQTAKAEDQRLELALKSTELEQLREARQDLAQALAQDVRAIAADVETRLDQVTGELGDEGLRSADRVMLELRRLVGLVEDSFALVQMEEGEYGLAASPVPVGSMVQSALDRNAVPARILGVSLSGAASEPDLIAIADPNVVGRVIDNLVGVAMAAAGAGGEVMLLASESGRHVELAVSETGPGSSPAVREQALELWARSTSHSARALGAAYHFCRLAVEAHGGTLLLQGDRTARRWVLSLPSRKAASDDFETTATS